MSENMNRGNRDFSKYDSMTTEELEDVLRFDPSSPDDEEPDVELLLYVSGVLVERKEQLNNDDTGNEAHEAWESFKRDYYPQILDMEVSQPTAEKPKILRLRWMRGAVAAAAVLVFIVFGSMTANAFGFDLWRIVATWASETFHLATYGEAELDEPKADNELEFTSLEDLLVKKKIEDCPIPTRIPEEYEFVDFVIDENPLQKKYIAIYKSGEKILKISIATYLGSNPELMEQSAGYDDIYESAGIPYYIFTDVNQIRALWITDSYECYISGELSIEEIEEMINSISER